MLVWTKRKKKVEERERDDRGICAKEITSQIDGDREEKIKIINIGGEMAEASYN